MKAVRIAAPLQIGVAEIEKPEIKADEILVKIKDSRCKLCVSYVVLKLNILNDFKL